MSPAMNNGRPTLPSLHELSLFDDIDAPFKAETPRYNDLDEFNDDLTPTPSTHCHWSCSRSSSASSALSTPSSSRAGSPSDAHPRLPPNFTLVYTTLDSANALVIVPPTDSEDDTPAENKQKPRSKPLLFVGPAMESLRRNPRSLVKGARMHPYRIVPGARRPSTSSASTTNDL